MPLINHSTSPPALPRSTSKIIRLSSSDFQLLGNGGISRMNVGIWLLSSASSPMTNLIIGTLYAGSGRERDEFVHIRPSGIFITLVR